MRILSDHRRLVFAIVVITICTSLVFAFSAHIRSPLVGKTAWLDSWFSSASVLFAKNWTQTGTFRMRLGMFWNPASVEFPTLASRELYSSYPPGAIVPVYVLGRLLGRSPDLELVMAWNLSLQFMIALTLCLLVFYVLYQAGMTWPGALLFALVPVPLELLLPGPMYLHLVPYFGDQAVLFPLALFVLCEAIRDEAAPGSRTRRCMNVAQGVLMFAGACTEWIFVFLAGLVFLKRLAQGEYKVRAASLGSVVVFFFPLVAAIALFAIQVIALGGGESLRERFGAQTGLNQGAFLNVNLDNFFWSKHFVRAYGEIGLWLAAVSAGYVIAGGLIQTARRGLRRDTRDLARLVWPAFLLLASCLLHVIVFRNHSKYFLHYFSALKFALPLAVIPLALAPAFFVRWLRLEGWRAAPVHIPLAICMLAASWAYALHVWPNTVKQLKPLPVALGGQDAVGRAQFVARSTGYSDVVFTTSDKFEINTSPLFLKDSMKRVYGVGSIEQMADHLKGIEQDYVVNLLVRDDKLPLTEPALQQLYERAAEVKTWANYKLVKIPKAQFLEFLPKN